MIDNHKFFGSNPKSTRSVNYMAEYINKNKVK